VCSIGGVVGVVAVAAGQEEGDVATAGMHQGVRHHQPRVLQERDQIWLWHSIGRVWRPVNRDLREDPAHCSCFSLGQHLRGAKHRQAPLSLAHLRRLEGKRCGDCWG